MDWHSCLDLALSLSPWELRLLHLGDLLFDLRFILAKVGGIVVIIFGLHMIGVFRIPFLEYDTRVQQMPDRKWGYLSSALMGVFFSAGWAPCVGPVLGAILTLCTEWWLDFDRRVAAFCLLGRAGDPIPGRGAWRRMGLASRCENMARRCIISRSPWALILVILGVMLFAGVFERIAQAGQFFWIDFGI